MTAIKKEPPFKQRFAVDTDVSLVAVQQAAAWFQEENYTLPTVLWVHTSDELLANQILDMMPRGYFGSRMVAIPDPDYEEFWWSVGTRRDRGIGSAGA